MSDPILEANALKGRHSVSDAGRSNPDETGGYPCYRPRNRSMATRKAWRPVHDRRTCVPLARGTGHDGDGNDALPRSPQSHNPAPHAFAVQHRRRPIQEPVMSMLAQINLSIRSPGHRPPYVEAVVWPYGSSWHRPGPDTPDAFSRPGRGPGTLRIAVPPPSDTPSTSCSFSRVRSHRSTSSRFRTTTSWCPASSGATTSWPGSTTGWLRLGSIGSRGRGRDRRRHLPLLRRPPHGRLARAAGDRPGAPGGVAMIAVETTCIRCGRTFTPSPAAIRRGRWRVCPSCRDAQTLEQGETA